MKSKILGKLEQRIMDYVWESDRPLTPGEVQEGVCCDLAYTTVMTELSRLQEKGILQRKKKGRAFAYFPKVSKKKFAEKNLAELFEGLVGSYGKYAISEFIDSVKRDPESIKLLQEFLKKQNS